MAARRLQSHPLDYQPQDPSGDSVEQATLIWQILLAIAAPVLVIAGAIGVGIGLERAGLLDASYLLSGTVLAMCVTATAFCYIVLLRLEKREGRTFGFFLVFAATVACAVELVLVLLGSVAFFLYP